MTRAEMRRQKRESEKEHTITYNLTKAQLDQIVNSLVQKQIPNVVEVVYSKNNSNFYVRVINDDPNSPTSTVSRGREIIYRDSNPEFSGEPTNYQIKEYANKLLQKLSTVEYKITFSHGYYPIRLGDCVLLNYKAAGINNVKAKVIKQSITCETGCKVTETAVYTSKLWG